MTESSTGPKLDGVTDGGEVKEFARKVSFSKKKILDPVKAAAALKNHSEAEKRRRQRINSHLSTMRNLIPSDQKMDKATVLAEVIKEIERLEKKSSEVSGGFPIIPRNWDEVKVERHNTISIGVGEDEGMGGGSCFMASLCCDYRPEVTFEVGRALEMLNVSVVKMEVSTMAHRMKLVFVFKVCRNEKIMKIKNNNMEEEEEMEVVANCVKKALYDILHGVRSEMESLSTTTTYVGEV